MLPLNFHPGYTSQDGCKCYLAKSCGSSVPQCITVWQTDSYSWFLASAVEQLHGSRLRKLFFEAQSNWLDLWSTMSVLFFFQHCFTGLTAPISVSVANTARVKRWSAVNQVSYVRSLGVVASKFIHRVKCNHKCGSFYNGLMTYLV